MQKDKRKVWYSLLFAVSLCRQEEAAQEISAWRKWWNKEFAIILSVWMTLPYKRETLYFPLLENCTPIISLYLFAI